MEGEGEKVRGGEKAMAAGGGGASTGAELRAKPTELEMEGVMHHSGEMEEK